MSHEPRASEAASPLVTRDILRAELSNQRSEWYRALWIAGVAIVAAVGVIAAVAAFVAMAD